MKYINGVIAAGDSVDTTQLAKIMIKLLGLNVSENALKAMLDILVTIAGASGNTADLLASAVKTLSNYLLKASINDSITFTIVQSLKIEKFTLTADDTELTEGDSTIVKLTDIVPAGSNSQNVLWSSSDESVLTVDGNGIVKARDAGGISSANKKTATVTATVDGVSESLEFTVKGKLITTPVDISVGDLKRWSLTLRSSTRRRFIRQGQRRISHGGFSAMTAKRSAMRQTEAFQTA